MTTPPPVTTPPKPQPTWNDTLAYPLGCVGAFIGAALGALIVKWGVQSGFYVIPAVGFLAGWGASLLARKHSWLIGTLAGLIAAAVGIWAEWKFVGAMRVDPSFAYFLQHFTDIGSFKLFIHVVSVAIAVWFGSRR